VSRGGYYYEPCPESAENLALMRRIDELHMQHPVYGRTRLTAVLRREGLPVNEKRIGRLMRVMGLEAIYCKPAAKGRNMPNSAAMLKTLSSSAFNDTI
jgi:putative transposase